ncbi:S-adenosyl-L-methionine-dependent methyltransferase [Infundibulicybe gibba]|nr:S-adenosyl-L-methionine-dependent methyltransferase [Infundibulicybe gibba]
MHVGKDVVDEAVRDGTEFESPFEFREEVTLTVAGLCPTGEAIALSPEPKRPWAVIIPFSLPGETIQARIYRNARMHSFADLITVLTPNPDLRDSDRIKCKYFGSCAGCQYQMLSYDTQLDFKRDVVVKAYRNFSSQSPSKDIPPIQSTIGSPLQYGYRTKITPHFDAPKNSDSNELNIGFNRVGTRRVMDIEECPIATTIINEALPPIRDNIIKSEYAHYSKGVSLLLRDSLESVVDPDANAEGSTSGPKRHICVTEHNATVREQVGNWTFEYGANSFFQNNNSVLVSLTDYVRDCIFPLGPNPEDPTSPTHLVDAYCGAAATRNAKLNNIPAEKCTFRSGDAANIFSSVGEFPPDRTVLVIDPPRKGCDDKFIKQLLDFRCKTVIYVSCNVHTQARDVGKILKATEGEGSGRKYVLETLRGLDLFPQTAHVESVAVLRLV